MYNKTINVLEYAKGVEHLIDPMAVGKTHYMQTKLAKLLKAAKSVDFTNFKGLNT